jgi:hypothetical protein
VAVRGQVRVAREGPIPGHRHGYGASTECGPSRAAVTVVVVTVAVWLPV